MQKQQVSTPVAIGIIVLVVLIAAFFVWRGLSGSSIGTAASGTPPDVRQQYAQPVPGPGRR